VRLTNIASIGANANIVMYYSTRLAKCGVASDVKASRIGNLGLPETKDFRLPAQDDSSSSSEEDDDSEDAKRDYAA
jgi:hypothetical protein